LAVFRAIRYRPSIQGIAGGGYYAGYNLVLSNTSGVFIGAGSGNRIGPNVDKVKNHNPAFGYNSFQGFIEEDCVQGLEQSIKENLKSNRIKRCKENDGCTFSPLPV